MARIFISYKRDAVPDHELALRLYSALEGEHQIFIDQVMAPGAKWADRIRKELLSCDFLVLFVSMQSVASEMVRAEIETVRSIADRPRPKIIPIRVAFDGELTYPLSAYLNPVQWAIWRNVETEPAVFDQVRAALDGRDLTLRVQPENTQSPVLPDANGALRVVRRFEQEAIRAIMSAEAVTLNIRGPRYMGKSLLLNELINAVESERSIAVIDFKLFDGLTLSDATRFYRRLCASFAQQLDLEWKPDADWDELPPLMSCTEAIKSMLRQHGRRTLLALDELDRLLHAGLRNEFFGMLRSWHEERSRRASRFKQLDLVLATSIDLEQYTEGASFSPFNVGTRVELADFEPSETAKMVALAHLSPTIAPVLHELLGGHPWLTNAAVRAIAAGRLSFAPTPTPRSMMASGLFADHLRHYLLKLNELTPAARKDATRALLGFSCDEATFAHLEGAGLARGSRHEPLPRCQLYKAFFERELAGSRV